MTEKIVAFGFDNVIKAGDQFDPANPSQCEGAPIPGMLELVRSLFAEGWSIEISTCRALSLDGRKGVIHWLNVNGFLGYVTCVSASRHIARVRVEADAIGFDGDTVGLADRIRAFSPWYEAFGTGRGKKRGSSPRKGDAT